MKDPTKFAINKPVPYGKPYLIIHPATRARFSVVASVDDGWGHVSVSLEKRTPTWDEMCFIKNMFFEPEELCLQIHPKKSQYVNEHRFCLHLWQPPKEICKLFE